MSDVKAQLIKLGAQQPDLQKHIKPILDVITARYEDTVMFMDRASAVEKMVGKFIRIKWTREAVFLEELPVRGKKRLGTLYSEFGYLSHVSNITAFIAENLIQDARVQKGDSYRTAAKKIKDAFAGAAKRAAQEEPEVEEREILRNIRFDEEEVWYLKVAPGTAEPITAEGADFTVSSSWTEFSAFSPDSDLHNHDPHYTKYQSKSAGAARKLYKILNTDPDALARISFNELGKWFDQNKISYDTRFSQWS